MTIAVKCPKCRHIARVNDSLAGKSAKCPSCRHVVRIPGGGGSDAASAAPAAGSSPSQAGGAQAWYVRTPDGETFGPISRSEMDSWLAEDRIDAECYLLEKTEKEWHAAADIYPQLGGAAAGGGGNAGGGIAIDTETSHSGGGHRVPKFHPRKYPAMTVVKFVFYVLAGLSVVSFLFSCIWVVLFGAAMVAGDSAAAGIAMMLLMLLFNFIYHAILVCMFMFMAETVKILVDIQSNTQEAAHYTKAAAR